MYKKTFYAISLCIVGTLGIPAHTTDLYKAARDDDPARMQELINAGHDVNARDEDDETALHDAVFMGNAQAVSCLIENGAETSMQSLYELHEHMKKSPFIEKRQAQEVASILYVTEQINESKPQIIVHSNANEDTKVRFAKIAIGQNRFQEANYIMQHTSLSTNDRFARIQLHAIGRYSRNPHPVLQDFINNMHKYLEQ